MPIYEYRCQSCSHEFETIQKVSEALLTTCPACSQETLRKKVSAAGFRLKGGGWYETDFKAGKKKNVAAEGGGDGAGKDTGSADASKNDGAGKAASGDGGAATKTSTDGGSATAAKSSD